MVIRLFDIETASSLAQILPVLLLAFMVELRRTGLHRRGRNVKRTRVVLGIFFGAFAVIETVLVLSIDGRVYPFQPSDLIAAIVIFALLWLLFFMSLLSEPATRSAPDRRLDDSHDNDDDGF